MTKYYIKQGTKKWHDLRRKRIGASEIYGLLFYYIKPEEWASVGINPNEFTESPYITAWQLYHKFKSNYYNELSLPRELGEFGLVMERYAMKDLSENDPIGAKYSKGHIVDNNIYSLASLDLKGLVDNPNYSIIEDSNGKPIDLTKDKDFVCEVKHMNLMQARKKNIYTNGIDWKYLFQHQYQMWLEEVEWGLLPVYSLKYDSTAERHYICGLAKAGIPKLSKYLTNNCERTIFIYRKFENIETVFNLALERFFEDVRSGTEPNPPSTDDMGFFVSLIEAKSTIKGTPLKIKSNIKKYIHQIKRFKKTESLFKNKKEQMKLDLYDDEVTEYFDDNENRVYLSSNGSLLMKEGK